MKFNKPDWLGDSYNTMNLDQYNTGEIKNGVLLDIPEMININLSDSEAKDFVEIVIEQVITNNVEAMYNNFEAFCNRHTHGFRTITLTDCETMMGLLYKPVNVSLSGSAFAQLTSDMLNNNSYVIETRIVSRCSYMVIVSFKQQSKWKFDNDVQFAYPTSITEPNTLGRGKSIDKGKLVFSQFRDTSMSIDKTVWFND